MNFENNDDDDGVEVIMVVQQIGAHRLLSVCLTCVVALLRR
jgi:hypothetical protein